jgi:hypothetical protein
VLNEAQARTLGSIVDLIDAYRGGRSSAVTMFNDMWGLIAAAEVRGTPEGDEVEALYYAASTADDARQAWIPVEQQTTDVDVEEALGKLRTWALSVDRDRDTGGLDSGDIPGH